VPAAVYAHDSDCVEYVKTDSFCLYERIDRHLTLIKDATGHNLIGFKLKGFRNMFERLKVAFELSDSLFVPLVAALEVIYTELGDKLFLDPARKAAYVAAFQLASNDNVKLEAGDWAHAA
jgi:hypothetical protein